MWLTILWENRRVIAEIVSTLMFGILIWYFGFHVPAELKETQQQVVSLQTQVEQGKKALTLLNDINVNKGVIDHAIQTRISTVRSEAIKPNAPLISGGRLPM